MQHRVKQITKHGAFEICRVKGAPDCDSAAMFVAERGGTIRTVEAIDDDARWEHNEMDWGQWENSLHISDILSRPS